MRIEEKYVKSGYFWLPERSDNKIPGILTIKDGGNIELEIIGSFDMSHTEFNDFDNINRIVGNVENDGYVTLENCFYIEKSHSFGGIDKSKIIAQQMYGGVAYDKDEKITFNTLLFSVDCIDEWIGISGFTNNNYLDLKTTTINYTQPENIIFQLDNGMQLEIYFTSRVPLGNRIKEIKITQKAYFKLKSEILKPFSDFRDIVYKITNFMCFAVDDTVSIKDVSATSIELQRKMDEGKFYDIPIYIYYSSRPYSEKIPNKSWHQMLFTYGSIQSNAQDIFNNWLNAYDMLSPAIGLYFSTKTNSHKYLEGKFLALAQGLETYHRRTSDEKLMDINEFDSLVVNIIKKCPVEQQKWLQGRLKHGNEISFSKRLQLIIESFKEKFGNRDDRKRLIRKIVDTRNYFTHYDEDLKDKAATKGDELWSICEIMEVIFQLHFLKVIGFNDKEIDNVIENNHPLKEKLKN